MTYYATGLYLGYMLYMSAHLGSTFYMVYYFKKHIKGKYGAKDKIPVPDNYLIAKSIQEFTEPGFYPVHITLWLYFFLS